MSKLRVGVIRGGIGREYVDSIETGSRVLGALYASGKYTPIDILVDREGLWHVAGIPVAPANLGSYVDVVFNALHGRYGEDGKLSKFFDDLGIPHTGTSALSGAMTLNKAHMKERAKQLGLKVPAHIVLPAVSARDEDARREAAHVYANMVHSKLSPPWVIKPLWGTGSHEVHYAETMHRLISVLEDAFLLGEDLLAEEYLFGKELSVGVLEDFRKSSTYLTSPYHVFKNDKLFYRHAKRDELYRLIPYREKRQEIHEATEKLIQDMNIRHYATIEFIDTNRGLYFMEINDLPLLGESHVFQKSIDRFGITLPEIIEAMLEKFSDKW